MKLIPVAGIPELNEFIYQYLNIINRFRIGALNIVKKDYEIIFVNCDCPLLLIYYVFAVQE